VDRVTPRPRATALIAAGGQGLRLGAGEPKQFLVLGPQTILEHSIERMLAHPGIDEVVVALPADRVDTVETRLRERGWSRVTCVVGGARRQDSVAAAFGAARSDSEVVVIHDAARPFVTAALIGATIEAAVTHGAAIAALPVRDTVKQAGGDRTAPSRPVTGTLPREDIFLAQTPQAFRREILARALSSDHPSDVTDEAMLVEAQGQAVFLVPGEATNVKITTQDDLDWARRHVTHPGTMRVGTGYDLHRLVEGRPLILGGVHIPFDRGLDGHSDADIVCHAVTDAVLGAAAVGDIGRLFPDTDPQWKDADSLRLLSAAVAHLHRSGFRVSNVDVTVIAQRPKLLPHLEAMRGHLASALQVPVASVSIKGKTNEQVDSMGRGESMACHAVAMVVS
jgi:2-C-methyl-D-erythritol 4-phosphate cytidylyltransferase/2-C-methyl-D-erythritol 2,4-cyclodiphosphate synthase